MIRNCQLLYFSHLHRNPITSGNDSWEPLRKEALTNNSQQGAEVRSMANEARRKIACQKGRHVKLWRHASICYLFLHPQMHIFPSCMFIIAKIPHTPMHPLRLILLPRSPYKTFIYLIKAPGTAFHAQPRWPFSPSGEALKLFIIIVITRLSRTYKVGWGMGITPQVAVQATVKLLLSAAIQQNCIEDD